MKLEWTEKSLEGFRNIRSRHFTSIETEEYKKRLLKNIRVSIDENVTINTNGLRNVYHLHV